MQNGPAHFGTHQKHWFPSGFIAGTLEIIKKRFGFTNTSTIVGLCVLGLDHTKYMYICYETARTF